MTHAMQLIKLLKVTPGLTTAEIAEATGWTKEIAHQTLTTVMRAGFVATAPKRYELTARGVTRSDWVPKTTERERSRRKEKRQAEREARMSPNERKAANDAMVAVAVTKQHPLATAWRAA